MLRGLHALGDEFAVLLEASASIEDARRIAERVQERLRAPFVIDEQEVFVGCSVGIVLNGPDRTHQPKEVLRHADLAMYVAKSRGKNRYEMFNPSMDARFWERAMRDEPGKIVGFEENELRRKDGTTFPVEVGVGAIDYGGRRLVFASARDLTERKQAEEALAEERNLLRTLIDNMPDFIFVKDAQSRFVIN
ncbi:MAG: PAS domain S-box protein, partial [Actinobacteria bacterium]|nr:PAS domain S-box protein [Actinomycetota bacterium]